MGGNVSSEAGALCHTAASVPSVSQSSAGPHQGLLVLLCLPPALPLLLPSLVAVWTSAVPGLQPGDVTSLPLTPWAGGMLPLPHTLTQSLLSFLGADLCVWEQGEKKRQMLISGSDVYLHTNTGTSATVPPLSKQQLPVQAGLCLQTLLRSLPSPPLSWGGFAPAAGAVGRGARCGRRGTENASQGLLPLSVTVLLAAGVAACLPPSFCPV